MQAEHVAIRVQTTRRAKRQLSFELTDLWFYTGELQSLATLNHLIKGLRPGLPEERHRHFQRRIEDLLAHNHVGKGELGAHTSPWHRHAPRRRCLSESAEWVLHRKRLPFDNHVRCKTRSYTHRLTAASSYACLRVSPQSTCAGWGGARRSASHVEHKCGRTYQTPA